MLPDWGRARAGTGIPHRTCLDGRGSALVHALHVFRLVLYAPHDALPAAHVSVAEAAQVSHKGRLLMRPNRFEHERRLNSGQMRKGNRFF